MTSRASRTAGRAVRAAALALWSVATTAQTLHLVQPSALRSAGNSAATASAELAAGQAVELLQLRGGWAEVRLAGGAAPAAVASGWLRASTLDFAVLEAAAAARVDTGRLAAAPGAVPLGIRALPPRQTRHALIVVVDRHRDDPARPAPPLAGAWRDVESAWLIARRLQVPPDNVALLRDDAASRDGIVDALRALDARVRPGDRVFVYWSGRGSRAFDAAAGGCVETLVSHDRYDIGYRELLGWLQPLARKADKLMLVVDAGHADAQGAADGGRGRSSAAALAPKSIAAADRRCALPGSPPGLSFEQAMRDAGLDRQDIAYLASARADEPGVDDARGGGLATAAWRDCLLGGAGDDDGSGAVTLAELAACAQPRIDAALARAGSTLASHLVLGGNPAFVPAWFVAPPAAKAQPAPTGTALPLREVLAQIHAQRHGQRRVEVTAGRDALRIGRDALELAVTSSHDGFVYVALLGSDQRTLQLLFPNALDDRNRIAAGQTLHLPREGWSVRAAGPPGEDTLLVVVAAGPRDLNALAGARAGPFVAPLTDADGRARLQWLLGSRAGCDGADCSDAFGSALLTVRER